MVHSQLPPHRISAGANSLQSSAPVKAQDSELAMVLVRQPCPPPLPPPHCPPPQAQKGPMYERQLSIDLFLEPTVPVGGVPCQVQYFLVPTVTFNRDFSDFATLPLWVDGDLQLLSQALHAHAL